MLKKAGEITGVKVEVKTGKFWSGKFEFTAKGPATKVQAFRRCFQSFKNNLS